MTDSQDDQAYSEHPASNTLLKKTVDELRTFSEGQMLHIHELVKIGLALSAEKKLDRLLEMIVSEARRFTNADGGTLYIKREREEVLDFSIVQNDTLDMQKGGTHEKITWPSIPLLNRDGSENHQNVCAHCALTGQAINIPDVYSAKGYDFHGTKEFDAQTGYRSESMLVIPMRNHEDEVIGVLQLLNVRDRSVGKVIAFPEHEIEIITSLASQAAIAVTNMRLIKGLEELLNAFVQTIADAIDEKSPYTAGHILRVAELAETIARKINDNPSGMFGGKRFSDDEMAELRMAAWMHDVGKITTPECIVDKASKLQTIFDRIELIRYRVEILKRDAEIKRLQETLARNSGADYETQDFHEPAGLDELLGFLENANMGGEFLPDESVAKIKEVSGLTLQVNGEVLPLLSEDEVENLTIRKGTLNAEERDVINNHVNLTIKMLQKLPFPKKLRHVPLYAGMHHEKLDGSGYPRAINGDDIPLQARILAVADVFEALTSADRPYKEGKLLSESMKIMGFMAKDGHLDGDLCDLLVEEGIVAEYARQVLNERQQDDFEWKGVKYSLKRSG